jgi:hypothetical protein
MIKKLSIVLGLILSSDSFASSALQPLKLLFVTNTQRGLTKEVVSFKDIYEHSSFVRVLLVSQATQNKRSLLEAFYASYRQQEMASNLRFQKTNFPEVGPEYVFLSSRYDRELEYLMSRNVAPGTGMTMAFAHQRKIVEAFPVLQMMPDQPTLLEFRQGNLYAAKVISEPADLQ